MDRYKSFEQLREHVLDEKYKEFVNSDYYNKLKFLKENNVKLYVYHEGIYNKRKNTVLIKSVKNPFTGNPIEAFLCKHNRVYTDGAKIVVLLKYDVSLKGDLQKLKENIFTCECTDDIDTLYNKIWINEKSNPGMTTEDMVLILNLFLKDYNLRFIPNDQIAKLSGLIYLKPKRILHEMQRYESILYRYRTNREHVEHFDKQDKKIIRLYELYLNDFKAFSKKVKICYEKKKRERGWDIRKNVAIKKSNQQIFSESSSKAFKFNLEKTDMEKMKKTSFFYFALNTDANISLGDNVVLLDSKRLNAFCSIPKGRKCNFYCDGNYEKTIVFTDDLIRVHRNGIFSRKMKIEMNQKDDESSKKKSSDILNSKQHKSHLYEIKKKKQNSFSIDRMSSNKIVAELKKHKNRISFTQIKEDTAIQCFDSIKAIKKIQLIQGMKNHVTLGHPIENRVANIVCYDSKRKQYIGIQILVHYCLKCHRYFDFYNSFLGQLKLNNIKKSSLVISYVDEHDELICFDEGMLNAHSKLNLFGYHVGYSGLNKNTRQALLKKLISGKYMSVAEIKNHLEFLVKFRGESPHMEYAKICWLEDIEYVNQLICKQQ